MRTRRVVVVALLAAALAVPAGAGEREHIGRYSTPEMADLIVWVSSVPVVVAPVAPAPVEIARPAPVAVSAPDPVAVVLDVRDDAPPSDAVQVGPGEVPAEPDWDAGPVATDPSWLWDGSGQTAEPVPWTLEPGPVED